MHTLTTKSEHRKLIIVPQQESSKASTDSTIVFLLLKQSKNIYKTPNSKSGWRKYSSGPREQEIGYGQFLARGASQCM